MPFFVKPLNCICLCINIVGVNGAFIFEDLLNLKGLHGTVVGDVNLKS